MNKITTRVLSAALLILSSGAAFSQDQGGNGQGSNGQGYSSPVLEPELDLSGAIPALMLMAGAVAVITGFRRTKP
jgi:hypothetical protein